MGNIKNGGISCNYFATVSEAQIIAVDCRNRGFAPFPAVCANCEEALKEI